ncbi:serine hydrolase domain-containing protein [Aureibacter tunicatorum]|uniref:CubicO group peptidase (Beta-lactamase class C family) n=1 Tax=Aureibacter tunicatorum TaxID=866807 RepID=A0AAE3XIE9_9BACT|nr:serine hydrolase [Aureibacter tunicatorum]MDR6238311.1 CubicO group peptidase (beta-lactamase class C family) [Aureibacter tunicatorum]
MRRKIRIANAFVAKYLCSTFYITHRPLDEVFRMDLNNSFLKHCEASYDPSERSVEVSMKGYLKRKAYFDDVHGGIMDRPAVKSKKSHVEVSKASQSSFVLNEGINKSYSKLDVLLGQEFSKYWRNTRALLVLKGSEIVYEGYSSRFDQTSIFPGWSMTKSLFGFLYGMWHDQKVFHLDESDLFEEWKDDDRRGITLRHLLQMRSGLDWDESYDKVSDVTRMLLDSESCSSFAMSRKLARIPGSKWVYSSGDSVLLSEFFRRRLGDEKYGSDIRLFLENMGWKSYFLEKDREGTYVASSYAWATAREWAHLGLALNNKGQLGNKRLVDQNWVDFMFSSYEAVPLGQYGAQVWLNGNGLKKLSFRPYKKLPSMGICQGFNGQRIYCIPEMNLSIVRLGLSGVNHFDDQKFVGKILTTL